MASELNFAPRHFNKGSFFTVISVLLSVTQGTQWQWERAPMVLPLDPLTWAKHTPAGIRLWECCIVFRPHWSRSAAVYSDQTFPWTICRCVCASFCPVHCGKTMDQIRMPFGIIGRTGPRMTGSGVWRSVHGKGYFWGECGARRCNQWGLTFAAMRSSSQITLGRLVHLCMKSKVVIFMCSLTVMLCVWFSDLAEQYTQCTLMSFLPPFTSMFSSLNVLLLPVFLFTHYCYLSLGIL